MPSYLTSYPVLQREATHVILQFHRHVHWHNLEKSSVWVLLHFQLENTWFIYLNLVNYFEVIFRKCKLLEIYNFAHTFYEGSIQSQILPNRLLHQKGSKKLCNVIVSQKPYTLFRLNPIKMALNINQTLLYFCH